MPSPDARLPLALTGACPHLRTPCPQLLMAYEQDHQTRPESCVPFGVFFDANQTPPHLIHWGIYREIATALNAGPHRPVGLSMLGLGLIRAPDLPPSPAIGTRSPWHRPPAPPLPCRLPLPRECRGRI